MKVKAIVFPEPNKFEIRELELRDIEEDEILVKSLYSGISIGTERWALTNKGGYWKYPIVPGYQNAGIVEKIGKKVTNFKEGDIVFTSYSEIPEGYFSYSGSHMSYVICKVKNDMPQKDPIKLEGEMNLKEVCLLTMATVGYNGANWKGVVSEGDSVIVIGQGLIGQMCAQNAKIRGASKVIGLDFYDKRVEISSKYSTDLSINPKKTDLRELFKKGVLTRAEVVVEATGIPENIYEYTWMVKYGGKMMLLGTYHGKSEIEWRKIHPLRITLYTTDYYTREEQLSALKLIQERKLKIEPLITHEAESSDALKIYDLMLNNPAEILGAIIRWV